MAAVAPKEAILAALEFKSHLSPRGNNHPAIPPPPAVLSSLARKGGGLNSELTQMDVNKLDGGVDPVVTVSSEDADGEQHANPFSCASWHHCVQLSRLPDKMGSASSSGHWNLDWNVGEGWPFSSFSSSCSSFSFFSSSSIVVRPFKAMKMMTEGELAR